MFRDHLADLGWGALGLGICFHLLRLVAVSRAWRNIIQAAYPTSRVPGRSILGAVFGGVGVSTIVPARGGDAVRVYMAKRSIEGSSYATLASTVVLLSLFDLVVAGSLVLWAGFAGLLPGAGALGPSFDFAWLVDNPGQALKIIGLILVILLVLLLWFAEDIAGFRHRAAQGFAILGDKRAYLRSVVLWQAGDWACRFAAVLLFLHAFGLPTTIHNALLVQVSAGLASLIPISPQGIGTEQALLLYVFRGQVSNAALLAFSVGMRITLMIVNAVIGFVALLVTFETVNWREHVGRSPR